MQRKMLRGFWGSGRRPADWWGKKTKLEKAADCPPLFPPCSAATYSPESYKAKVQYWHKHKWA